MTTPPPTNARPFSPEKALKIVAILYGVAGGVAVIAGLFCMVVGVLAIYGVIDGGYLAGTVIMIGGICFLGGALWFTVCWLLRKRRGRVFCLVNGALILPLFIPIGTALGIYTLILLTRREVIDLFIAARESRAIQE